MIVKLRVIFENLGLKLYYAPGDGVGVQVGVPGDGAEGGAVVAGVGALPGLTLPPPAARGARF